MLDGRDAVIAECSSSAAAMADVRTQFGRFVVIPGPAGVAVDAVARYTDADGSVSRVSSCDIVEFRAAMISTITTYAVELDAAPPAF